MTEYKGLVLDPDTCLLDTFSEATIPNVTLCSSATAEQLTASVRTNEADFIILDLDLPKGVSGLSLVTEMRKHNPTIPAILLMSHEQPENFWRDLAMQQQIECVQTPISAARLAFYVKRLLETGVRKFRYPLPLQASPISELRNDDSGRLDANKIASIFDLTMAEVAACVDRPRSTLVKTPDSMSIQGKLQSFERIAASLLMVTGSVKGLRMWLNSPAPSLDDHTPIEVLKRGKVEMLADWVDDARLGSPG